VDSCIDGTMIRRTRLDEDEVENHERWLVSYADLITLLFALFVVMYSVSSVNHGKYRVLSESIASSFGEGARSLDPIQIGELVRANILHNEPMSSMEEGSQTRQKDPSDDLDDPDRLVRISNQIEEVLSPFIDQELIDIKRDDLWVEIEMKSSLLFRSGGADLADEALPLLRKISEILREVPNSLQVEGYTDNLPINTIEFPSNWELSAARSASVVHRLVLGGVNPRRLSAIGYAEFQPIADNRFEEGRYKNRRVVLVLLSQSAARHKLGADERSKLLASTPKLPSRSKVGILGP